MGIKLSSRVTLKEIDIDDYKDLFNLMSRIYPPAYQYLWNDDCSWYLNHVYTREAVANDINQKDLFYFVLMDHKFEGILKIQINCPYPDQPKRIGTRLHRIYLSEEIHGKGVSKLLMEFTLDIAKKNKSEILWLDCMDTKVQALKYYEKNGFKKGTLSQLNYDLLIDESRGIYLMWKEIE